MIHSDYSRFAFLINSRVYRYKQPPPGQETGMWANQE